jgi:S-methylmethionine-dependent homocysteine/selenocysteine methylase
MARRNIVDRLRAGDVLLMDGATGSELQRRGVDVDKGSIQGQLGCWSAAANLDAPDVVQAIHEDYLREGAEIIISNNFYTTPTMLDLIGERDRWEEYTRRGGEIAVAARDAINADAYVAGGIAAPYKCNLREEFEGQARVLAGAGVDFMLAEYMGGDEVIDDPIADCVTAVDACAVAGIPVFLGVCRVSVQGTLYNGESFAELVDALKGHPVEGIFLMCSYPQDITACLPRLREAYDGPIGAYAHLEYSENQKFGDSPDEPFFNMSEGANTPQHYAEIVRGWLESGVQIVGGCCATRPDHIRALRPLIPTGGPL